MFFPQKAMVAGGPGVVIRHAPDLAAVDTEHVIGHVTILHRRMEARVAMAAAVIQKHATLMHAPVIIQFGTYLCRTGSSRASGIISSGEKISI